MIVKIKKLHEDAVVPEYMTKGSVGFDVSAIEDYIVGNYVVMVRTGLAFQIPEGYEMNVRARSGLSLHYPNYVVITGGGTVDFDYRGELFIPVMNIKADDQLWGNQLWEIKKGDRIAQCIIKKVEQISFEVVDELDETERSSGGYGSTG